MKRIQKFTSKLLYATFNAPAPPLPLLLFRLGLPAILVFQAASMWNHIPALFTTNGVIDASALPDYQPPTIPVVDLVIPLIQSLGIESTIAIYCVFIAYVIALLSVMIGYRTRIAAATALVFHAAWCAAGPMSVYGVDAYARVGLFLLVLFGPSEILSAAARRDMTRNLDLINARRFLTALRMWLAMSYCASGFEKALGIDWWTGESIHRALYSTGMPSMLDRVLVAAPLTAAVLSIGTVILEFGYPLFAGWRSTRHYWVSGIVAMHAGIFFALGLHSFAGLMILLNVIAWLVPSGVNEFDARIDPTIVANDGSCRVIVGAQARKERQAMDL